MHNASTVYQIDQIRELETLARERFGISGMVMMERAGHAAFTCLMKRWPNAKRIAVVCGTGNNGGDGYVLAEIASQNKLDVTVWLVGDAQKLKNEALQAFEKCEKTGVTIKPFLHVEDFHNADVIVDALLGIGVQGEVRGDAKLAIDAMNFSSAPVLALDVPSGLDADTGCALGAVVKATATITFLGMKLGLLTGAGAAYAGDLYYDGLDLPADIYPLVEPKIEKLRLNQFARYLKPRLRDAHKGDMGHVLVVGGHEGFSGAARMSAEAALRVGAGLVSVATSPKHAEYLNLTRPELMCHGVKKESQLNHLLEKATVVVIGPGLGQTAWSKMLLKTVLKSKLPLVVDADALNLISAKPSTRKNWVLTPHPGEAGRLLNQSTADVQQNRLAALNKLQHTYHGVCVLKGAGTLILAPDESPALCDAGNPGMATAGMGDVLSGVIGGLIAQGVPLADAAKLGVCLHAVAGDAAAQDGGERGMLAMDLMPFLRKMINLDFKQT